MQRMGHSVLPFIVFAVCVASQQSTCTAQAAKQTSTAPIRILQQEQRHTQTGPHTSRTPFERIFLPGFQTRLASLDAVPSQTPRTKSGPLKTAQSSPSSDYSATFGGFFAAPFYSSLPDTACVVDPNNCGVAATVSADFNKDGKPDLAVVEYDGTLNILLNDGAGGFLPPAVNSSALALSPQVGFISVTDFNNDGYPDLIILDNFNNAFIVFLNRGDGTFAAGIGVPSSANGSIGALAVGDVNGDGKPDVAVISYNSVMFQPSTVTLQVFLGNGDGTFKSPAQALSQSFNLPVPIGVEIVPNGLALVDLNNDKKLDLVYVLGESISDTAGQVNAFVALGNNDGTFRGFGSASPVLTINTPLENSAPPPSGGVYAYDLNEDNKPDLILSVLGRDSGVYSALGNGDGTFQSGVDALGASAAAYQLAFADVNGDGYPDMICESDYLAIYAGHGDGTFGASLGNYVISATSAESLSIGDFNGDGILDIVQAYEQASVLFGKGDGTFLGASMLSSTTAPTAGPENILLFAAGDVNGDGNTDVIALNANGLEPLMTGLSDGNGNFTYTVAFPPDQYPDLLFAEPFTADFNGDGYQDIILVATNGLAVALSHGDGTFQSPVSIPLGSLNCILNYAASGDLLANGHQDIVLTYPGDSSCGGSGSVPSGYFVILGNGDGTFAAPQFYAFGAELYSAVLADLNGDGRMDLLLDDVPFDGSGPFAVYYLPGNGDGTFGSPFTASSGFIISQVLVGDFNQDGKQDLVLLSEGDPSSLATAGILVYPGQGDGTFGSPTLLAAGNFFLNGVLTDVNGDGLPDLVVGLYGTNGTGAGSYLGLSALLGQGGGAFSPPINTLIPGGILSYNVFSGSFLSDGAPDIVLQGGFGPALYLNQSGTSVALTTAPPSVNQGAAVTLTAEVAATVSRRPLPTGTVTFYANGTRLGSAALSGGHSAFSTVALPSGTDSITAAYSGDGNFNPNARSGAVSVTVASVSPAFTLTSAAATLSLGPGQLASTTLDLTANAAFSGSISFAASGLPENVSVLFAPGTITLASGQTAESTLVVSRTGTATASRKKFTASIAPFAALLTLACFSFLMIAASRRRLPGRLPQLASAVLLFASLAALPGCGGGAQSAKTGIANITITATPSNAAGSAQTIILTLTIR
jgi:hypothetical protein